jgi:hypothetical protein
VTVEIKMAIITLVSFFVLVCACVARPGYERNGKPYAVALQARQAGGNSSTSLQVDLGYEIYQGVSNSTSGINIWRG